MFLSFVVFPTGRTFASVLVLVTINLGCCQPFSDTVAHGRTVLHLVLHAARKRRTKKVTSLFRSTSVTVIVG